MKQHRHLIWTKLAYVIFKRAENFSGKKEQYINSALVSVVGWYLNSYKKDTERDTVDLEIFVVKIFSWFAQTTKIKNTKYILQWIIITARTLLFAQFHSTAS